MGRENAGNGKTGRETMKAMKETLKAMIRDAMRGGNAVRRDDLKYLVGEIERMTDGGDMGMGDFVAKVVRPCRKRESERAGYAGETAPSPFALLLAELSPPEVTEDDVRKFVAGLPDRNPSRIGEIIRHFGGAVDGAMVRRVLLG